VPSGVPVALRDVATLVRRRSALRADQLARVFIDRGVTFAYAGEERPFPLDLIPRIIDAVEWDHVTRGVRQRTRTLEMFLADIYGPGNVLDDGVVPRRLVTTSAHFQREASGIEPAGGVRVHISGVDLIRDEHGDFRVLEDNLRIPSGVSYVIENRRAMAQTLPAIFAEARVRPAEFLLLDRLFRRSALHALTTAEECLRELGPVAGRGTTRPTGYRPAPSMSWSPVAAATPTSPRSRASTTARPRHTWV
jgi:uncharacterized circularly permuted ATP-grasp superfamily protein